MKIPQRHSLLLQVTESLREALQTGVWHDFLPGERELCRRLHVSRPTIRLALDILTREKLIENSPGKPRRILKSRPAAKVSGPTTVTLLAKVPMYKMSRNRLFLFNELNRTLQENNIRLEIFHHEGFGSPKPHLALKALEKRGPSGVYILALTSREVQAWFADRGIPALILGSAFNGINLPSIRCNYPALGRHAAGTLLSKGHRHIALVAPSQPLAGDLETELAFREVMDRPGEEDRCCHLLRYTSDPADLLSKWTLLEQITPPITAVFSIYPAAALAILNHLISRQIPVPGKVSFLCRDGDPLCEWIHPRLAYYQLPLEHFATRLSSLVLTMLDSGNLPMRHTDIIPDLEPGESLQDAPDS